MILNLATATALFSLVLATPPLRRQDSTGPKPIPDESMGANWVYQGCWIDGEHGRILYQQSGIHEPMTMYLCAAECQRQNYLIGGVQYGSECWCGNEILNGGRPAPDFDAQCNFPWDGDPVEACGGILHMSVYSEHGPVVIPPPSVKLVTEPGWTYQGCYKDTDSRVFPDFVRYYGTTTEPKFCINRCAEASYEAAGLEFGSECWCGTLDQFASAEQAAEGDCWSICQGDQASFCGGPNRLTVYTKG